MADTSVTDQDNFAPIGVEYEAALLPVAGELPEGLNGTLFRNGPNPQFPPADPRDQHWFAGDGMVHAFTLQQGRASYRNRWVRTDKWLAERAAGRAFVPVFGPPSAEAAAIADTGVANTNIVWHGGRLLALEEAHLPIELDPRSLATRGVLDCAGALRGPFTAHPKTDPVTGELVFFGYSAAGPLTPAMHYGTIAPDGRVTRFERFDAPYCSMVHDFMVTERHVMFPILPLSGSMQRAMAGEMPFACEPGLGGHIGVIHRDAGVASLRWFHADACYVFHVLNAWEDGARLMADVRQYDVPPLFPVVDGTVPPPDATRARLVRWTLDLDGGTDAFGRAPLDDMAGEFPRIDDRRAGLPHRFGAFAGHSGAEGRFDTIAWLDLPNGRRTDITLPRGDATSDPVFVVHAADAPEGDGWLLAVVWRAAKRRSDLIVLDTDDVARGPVATVRLDHRVPFGFYGNWAPAV